ncbi:DUF2321 domain-containing protein [Fusobacterium pseudoperiodonticum]|uniref:DUF2321 domain-containing protein n=1 Tax=Fusobacterium pseudoperiodonticum TaxID=2663009 RepID=UPI0030D2C16C
MNPNEEEKISILKSAICKKGHLQISTLKFSEKYENPYCKECGSEIIDKCPHCNAEIQGGTLKVKKEIDLSTTDFFNQGYYEKEYRISNNYIPKYCHNCGKPYPWIENFLNTYKDTLSLALENETELQNKIYNATEELVKNNFDLKSPMANFFKLLLNKTGDLAKDVVVNTLSSIASEQFLQFLLK